MALGASIVNGQGSTDKNGFRYALRNRLIWEGNPVNMIGSQNAGNMADGSCECYPGKYAISHKSSSLIQYLRIFQVRDKSTPTWASRPNLILIHVGTNDCAYGDDDRLGEVIDQLFNAIPEVTIIASTLLPNTDGNTQANINIYNRNIPGMVRQKQQEGKKLLYVDFSSSWFSTADLVDPYVHSHLFYTW